MRDKMARIDRALYDSATFPHRVTVATRFDDLDLQGHVNNAAAMVMLQEARVMFNNAAGLAKQMEGGLRMMVAAIQVEFSSELHHPGEVDVRNGVLKVGTTSFTIAQVAEQNGRGAIYAQIVLVTANASGPVAMPAGMRAAFERLQLRDA
jgi:acyl-CoA thioester hydrolase